MQGRTNELVCTVLLPINKTPCTMQMQEDVKMTNLIIAKDCIYTYVSNVTQINKSENLEKKKRRNIAILISLLRFCQTLINRRAQTALARAHAGIVSCKARRRPRKRPILTWRRRLPTRPRVTRNARVNTCARCATSCHAAKP